MNPGPRYRAMTGFTSFADLRAACLDLPAGDDLAAATAARRDAFLTKPPGSLGLLEDVVVWLARWQGRAMPRLDRVEVLVFAGNHGVVAQGVSAYPAAVTAQMVANFAAGGAAINQLAAEAGANLHVIPLSLDAATADFTQRPAMDEAAFLAAVAAGYDAVPAAADLVCLGEMGIGNTTAASAGPAAAPASTIKASPASARRSTPRSPGTGRCSAIPCRSPRRWAAVSLPPSSARRSRHGGRTSRG